MGKNKISLSFVNDGKEFVPPGMTVATQEKLYEDMVKIEKKHKQGSSKYNREVNKMIVLRTMQIIDKSITYEDINNMHPDDYVILFDMIWISKREITGEDGNFRGMNSDEVD